MRIILTHEQADFDSLASMLGAYLLDEVALPLLPHRMNRNVRAFVNLYGVELPFIERRDLPSEPVEAITLVDTQSMVSVKGYNAQTQVTIIDHHPQRGELPTNWRMTNSETGANTTLFVEEIMERDGFLTTTQATLLLMGIYEDTGSLTYARTTARDLRAAAYLLEEGANLGIAVDFLNHPLSLQQQALYDKLRREVESLVIHGQTVVLACGDAHEMEEEISTIAHKLRDLLDPDALILLVKTRSGIQMIARSTSDAIDVADLTEHFGGGGHARAAAGLVHDRSLEEVRQDLIQVLPEFIKPSLTVAQIMSSSPQVIAPDTSAEEAVLRMQRYGYEGYPVVRDGRVIGLLNRRAVDRAMSHKLNLPAASLMEAGEVTVHPEDTIEHLQHLMTETGWGQIPVVRPEDGLIIGIVTRTDLIKTLTQKASATGLLSLSERLESALPEAHIGLLKIIGEMARQKHAALYIVGGFVRDLILECPSLDFDLVVEGDAIALAQALKSRYGGRFTHHTRFGTAKWFLKGPVTSASGALNWQLLQSQLADLDSRLAAFDPAKLPDSIDLITARTEFYTYPTALPTVERGNIKHDLHRRDFTINTLALRLDSRHYGELHDYYGGLSDLRQRFVRCLHSLSFVDDPTRMLRAVRFEQRFGFTIEERTRQLIGEAVSLMTRVSGDRIRHELDHILDEERSPQMLARLEELGLLVAIHPGLSWDEWLETRLQNQNSQTPGTEWQLGVGSSPVQAGGGLDAGRWNGLPLRRVLSYILWMMRLPVERARSVLGRLKVARLLVNEILEACSLWRDMPSLATARRSQVVKRLDEVSPLALYAVFIAQDEGEGRELLLKYVREWKMIMPVTAGRDLMLRRLPPGPIYGRILDALRMAWLDGEVDNVEGEMVLLDRLVNEAGTG